MADRTVSEDDLARLKAAREEADRRYNEALTDLDAAVQTLPALPPPPPAPDDFQVAALNERWDILALRSMPAGWRGRIARFVWGLVEPLFARQQAFNSALVDHLNRNAAAAHAVPPAIEATRAMLHEQVERTIRFQSRLILLAQQVTPYVDTKDYEFNGLARRLHEDDLDRIERIEAWLHAELPRLDAMSRGVAAGMSGLSDEMLKRFESATTRAQRADARLGELTDVVAAMQQLTQTLRRALERRADGVPQAPAVPQQAPGAADRLGAAAPPGHGEAQQMLASDPIHSHQYVGFEDLYRGSEVDIRRRMLDYARLFAGASDVLDIGCGRGEFLTLLKEQGVSARGIDLNHEMVARCQAEGLDVTEADALGYLSGLPDESLGGLIATQVVEHLAPDYLLRLLTAAFDKLRPGAHIALETINTASWAAFFDSYIRDLTHVRPVHPDTLKYLVTASGFVDARIDLRSPYPPESKLTPLGPEAHAAVASSNPPLLPVVEAFDRNVERLNGLLFTYMDYAIIARRP